MKIGVTAVVLAGGRGHRFNGRDKGLIPLWGEPLVCHVIARIAPQVDETRISANRNLESYRALGYPVVQDQDGDFAGPLAGIAAAMDACPSAQLLVVPCDTPCLPRDLCMRLRAATSQPTRDVVVAHDGVRLQNTVALLPVALRDDIREQLDHGEYRLESFLRRHAPIVVDFSDEAAAFLNVNSTEELDQLQRAGTCPES
ncbi:MAG: molybdenum cofactor guanylyltransferase MobA [Acidiferrobacteraceae bacterium]